VRNLEHLLAITVTGHSARSPTDRAVVVRHLVLHRRPRRRKALGSGVARLDDANDANSDGPVIWSLGLTMGWEMPYV
jgi:hypothetical protein